jgi:type I restriction enzyme S subunit
MTTEGPLGEVAQLDEDTAAYALGQRIVCMRGKSGVLDNTFLKFLLMSPIQQGILASYATGTTVAGISQKALRSIPLSLPPHEDQLAIGQLLGALDDRIDLNRRMNETLEAIVRAIFKDWFVDFGPTRAKMEGRAPYLAPEIWSLFPDLLDNEGKPQGWRGRRVGDILELAYGKALKASDRVDGTIPVYGSGGITGYHNTPLADGPSIIVGRKGTVGSLFWEDGPFFPIDTVFYVNPRAPLTFCFYLLQTLGLDQMNTDAAVPGLNRNNVYRLELVGASDHVRSAFDEIAKPLREKMREATAKSETLAATRDLLLPKLMSGEIQVRDAEKIAEAAQ